MAIIHRAGQHRSRLTKSRRRNVSHGLRIGSQASPLRTAAPYGLPAHRLGDCAGRFPGLRVVAPLRPAFPGSRRIPVAAWTRAHRLQLRGQPRFAAHSLPNARCIRVPSFVPGATRETSTIKCSVQSADESSVRREFAAKLQRRGRGSGKTFAAPGLKRDHGLFYSRRHDST